MRSSPCSKSTAPGSSSTRSSSNYHVTQYNNPSFTHSHHPPHDYDDQPTGECQNRVEDDDVDISGGHRGRVGGPMLPVFLNGLTRPNIHPSPTIPTSSRSSNSSHGVDSDSELVEVELVLREDGNIVLHSVTPTTTSRTTPVIIPTRSTSDRLGRSTSLTSRPAEKLRRLKSWWKRSASSRSFGARDSSSATGAEEEDVEMQQHRPAEISSRERQMIARQLNRNRSTAQAALKGLRFISRSTAGGEGERKVSSSGSEPGELWRQVELRFDRLAKNGLLDRNDFGECIGMMNDSKEFAVGIFDALARRKRRRIVKITKEEMYDFWLQLSDQSFDARLQIFFDIADRNEDGRITRDEVQELIVLSASANRLDALMDKAHEYANLIMEELDRDNLGYIELWQLEMLLLQRDANADYYSRPLSTASYGWTSAFTFRPRNIVRRVSCTLRCLLLENWQRGWIILLWFLAMAALFIWKFLQYRNRAAFQVMGYCLCTAKGAAETLKLNMALILLPVCRNTLTRLRATRARNFIPFDDNINFHKMIAFAIVMGIVLHAGTHLACDFPLLVTSSPEKFSLIASDFEGGKKPTYGDLLTGIEGLTGIAMVILMAISFTLATSRFRRNVISLSPPFNRLAGYNAFWYSHHLFALVYLLLLVHGIFLFLAHKWTQKTTWMYISVPVILYVMERSLRTCRSEHYTAKLLKVSELPGAVFTIIMSKPQGFKYRSGQYIFLQCPAISKFEWHPFSITSSPGDNYLSLHIRIAGDWTHELKKILLTADTSSNGRSTSVIGGRLMRFEDEAVIDQKGLPRLLIDGPYGAPAQDYQNYDVLLLVGLGIGATPFISILQDLLNNYRAAEDRTDSNGETSTSDESLNSFASMTTSRGAKKSIRTKSAHFYWVTREHASFDWFKGVMEEVAQMDHRGLIDMHNYLTCVYEEGDARSTLITMVNALNHAKYGVDILSGTRVKTHFARPNWKEVFTRIAKKHPYSTVGVFYCGRPVLAKELKKLTHEMSHKTTTRFEFHKEHF